jgi:T5orf172 domain.
MPKSLEELVPNKQDARLRIYAYAIHDEAHKGWLKVGQTTRGVKRRVAEQVNILAIKNFTIEVDESAERENGTTFSDHDVRNRLKQKGFGNPDLEWMECSPEDVKTAITELREGIELGGTHHLTFGMRDEQKAAVNKTYEYFHSIWQEGIHKTPRFLWNAKMRFGKTFATYKLAEKLGAKKILVVTFKPRR